MRVPIEMPHLGNDLKSGRIAAWLKAVGDHVERGEPIAEIEIDKATIEMGAKVSGTLVELRHAAGDDVPVGEVIAEMEVGD